MTEDEYVERVRCVLTDHRVRAVAKLNGLLANLPPLAHAIEIEVFVDQDGEGFLDVQASLSGPDLYVLNKSISAYSELFKTRMVSSGLEPPLPLMGWDTPFSVHDVLTDTAAAWIVSLWPLVEKKALRIPVTLTSHEGYGSLPVALDR